MTILITVILTLLAWQLATWIFYLVTDHEENTIIFACFLWTPIALLARFVVRRIALWRCRKYNCYQFFGKDAKWIYNFYLTAKDAEKFKQHSKFEDPNKEYYIRLLREGKEFKSTPCKSDILTLTENGVKSPRGFDTEYLNKFLKNS